MTPIKRSRTTAGYRYLAVGFGALTVVVLSVIVYVAFARARIMVTLEPHDVRATFDVSIAAAAEAHRTLGGTFITETVTGSATASATEQRTSPAKARGTVRITNTTGSVQPLAATTRLLSASGVLFRTRARVDVPAHGSLDVTVEADEAGPAGEIEPQRFTIPGLRSANQQLIYGESLAAMTGGTVASSEVSAKDLAETRATLLTELRSQAQTALQPPASTTTITVLNEQVRDLPSRAPDQLALELTLEAITYDPAALEALLWTELEAASPPGERVVALADTPPTFDLKTADRDAGTAIVSLIAHGQSVLDPSNPVVAPGQFVGKTRAELERYATVTSGVESIAVSLSPFWARRTPNQSSRITVVFATGS